MKFLVRRHNFRWQGARSRQPFSSLWWGGSTGDLVASAWTRKGLNSKLNYVREQEAKS